MGAFDAYKLFTGLTVGDVAIFSVEARLVAGGATNLQLGIEQANGNTSQMFTNADGLNTSTFVKLQLSAAITTTSIYLEFGQIPWAPSATAQSSGNVELRNISFKISGGLAVQGDLHVAGTLSATTKSFDIPHPDPSKADHRLRHWCVECDSAGGALLYTRQLSAVKGTNHISLPSWYAHLCADTMCFACPVRHFGSCWADLDEDGTVVLQCSKAGRYNVLISARRKDHCATQMCPQDVEYISELPRPAEHSALAPVPGTPESAAAHQAALSAQKSKRKKASV